MLSNFWNNWRCKLKARTLESRAEIVKLMKMHCSYDPPTIILPIFFIHSTINGRLGCFPVLAIVNSAVMNMGIQLALGDTDCISFEYT